MNIRIAKREDVQSVYDIHQSAIIKTCSGAYTEEQVSVWLANDLLEKHQKKIDEGLMFVAEMDDAIVGYVSTKENEITAVFVDPNVQNKGIGKLLLEYGINIVLQNYDTVIVESTLNAEVFYKSQGFKKIREDVHVTDGVSSPVIILEYLRE